MSRLPKSWTILGEEWEIIESDNIPCPTDPAGLCRPAKKVIYVKKTQPHEEKMSTLLHELFHALFSELSFENTSLTDDMEELIVDHIARFVTKCFRLKIKRQVKHKTVYVADTV